METIFNLMPSIGTIVVVVLVLALANQLLERERRAGSSHQFRNQLTMLALTALSAVAIIMTLPIGDAKRGQLLGLIGIVLSAAVALSATTFLGNALAGLMLRSIRNFRIGDFIRCGDHFGRVSERGLLHTEVQTEDRDLTTLPNLYLVTHPVTTVRASGTIVSATVSLGYDVPRTRIESCLVAAAEQAALSEPFVQVLELGDFSVVYRAAGLLTEVKNLVTARSNLRAAIMDCLHEDGIEIVSPSFMNQRVLNLETAFIPAAVPAAQKSEATSSPEAMVFDKAEEAESLEKLKLALDQIGAEITELNGQLKATPDEAARADLEHQLERLATRQAALEKTIAQREAAVDQA